MGLQRVVQRSVITKCARVRTIVEVLIVMVAILFATLDVTVADPSPELSWVNLDWSWSSFPLNFIDTTSPLLVLTGENTRIRRRTYENMRTMGTH